MMMCNTESPKNIEILAMKYKIKLKIREKILQWPTWEKISGYISKFKSIAYFFYVHTLSYDDDAARCHVTEKPGHPNRNIFSYLHVDDIIYIAIALQVGKKKWNAGINNFDIAKLESYMIIGKYI